ncbi:MAG: CHASE2 domain-containing protein, partial [Ignavibacteriales bacterium]|nr:CHASE2 domain-containing protein [Ignavibacteriales bacterium]
MISSNYKLYIIGISAIITVLLIMNLFPAVFNFVDQAFLNDEYQLKGESKIDSSIVILYLSNSEIEALGGLPLKRTYYALVIDVLKELGVRAIGIDIAFYDANRKHPEYDILLSSVVKNAGNVVLSGYFRSVGDVMHDTTTQTIPELFTYQKISGTSWQKGSKISLPYSELLTSAQSIGHTHLIDESRVPLFIQSDDHLMPSFAFEVFRLGIGVKKTDIVSTPSFLN